MLTTEFKIAIIFEDVLQSLKNTPKGKPNGPGSTSTFFHLQCRCKSRIVAQWSMLIVNSNKNLSMN
jgi:hypothetical protein